MENKQNKVVITQYKISINETALYMSDKCLVSPFGEIEQLRNNVYKIFKAYFEGEGNKKMDFKFNLRVELNKSNENEDVKIANNNLNNFEEAFDLKKQKSSVENLHQDTVANYEKGLYRDYIITPENLKFYEKKQQNPTIDSFDNASAQDAVQELN